MAKRKATTKRAPGKGRVARGTNSTEKKEKALVGFEAFKTRQRANQGFRLPLLNAEGHATEHWLYIIGIDSDAFQKAKAAQGERMLEIGALPDEDAREEASLQYFCEFLAAVVRDWSFSDPALMPSGEAMPCTLEAVADFMREAPQIRNQVEKIVSQRSLFFRMQAASVSNTQSVALS
jgi:hypothetical protein